VERSGKISAPTVSLPKGGGAISDIGETFQPNVFTGTADLSIPIATSPARALSPQLTLDYSSGTGNGIFGMGFSLSIPKARQCANHHIPLRDAENAQKSCVTLSLAAHSPIF